MSGSPKHTTAQLAAAQERRLREERERRAAEERARREAEERRLKLERFQQAKAHARTRLTGVGQQLAAATGSSAGRFVAAELASLQARFDALQAEVERAGDEAAVHAAAHAIEPLIAELRRVQAEGEAAQLAAHLAREESALARVQRAVGALDVRASQKFDPGGMRRMQDALGDAEAALGQKSPQQAAQAIARARSLLEAHAAAVNERQTQWAAQHSEASRHVDSVADLVAGLRVDPVVMRWHAGDVQALEQRWRKLTARLDAERYGEIPAEAAALRQAAQQLVQRAGEAQLQEDKRTYILNSILQVMQGRGFVLQQGFPTPEHPDDPRSAQVAYFQRIGGGGIAVSVPQSGDIQYDVEGFRMDQSQDATGGVIRTCDDAEELLESLHQTLDTAFGVKCDEIRWAGKPAGKRARQADELPRATPTSAPQRRAGA